MTHQGVLGLGDDFSGLQPQAREEPLPRDYAWKPGSDGMDDTDDHDISHMAELGGKHD